jgi:hypothetical protein
MLGKSLAMNDHSDNLAYSTARPSNNAAPVHQSPTVHSQTPKPSKKPSHQTETLIKLAGKAVSEVVDRERSSSPSQQGSSANPMGNQNVSGTVDSYSSDGKPSLKSPDQQFPQMGFGANSIINQPILSDLRGIETNLQQSIGNVHIGIGPDALINQPILSDLRGAETNLLQSIGNVASGLATWQPSSQDLKYMGDGLKLGMKVMSHVHIPGGHHKGQNGGLRSRLASMVNGKGGEKSHSQSTDAHEGQNGV